MTVNIKKYIYCLNCKFLITPPAYKLLAAFHYRPAVHCVVCSSMCHTHRTGHNFWRFYCAFFEKYNSIHILLPNIYYLLYILVDLMKKTE